jgi:hypothetical protein
LHQCTTNRDPTFIRVRQCSGAVFGECADADPVEHQSGLRRRLAPSEPQPDCCHREIVENREIAKQPPGLERSGDPSPSNLMGAHRVGRDTIQPDTAAGRRLKARQHVDKRCLAGAVRTDQPSNPRWRNVERHVR